MHSSSIRALKVPEPVVAAHARGELYRKNLACADGPLLAEGGPVAQAGISLGARSQVSLPVQAPRASSTRPELWLEEPEPSGWRGCPYVIMGWMHNERTTSELYW